MMRFTSTALLLPFLALAGCGGGGRGSTEVNLRVGAYSGPFAYTPRAPITVATPFQTDASGTAMGTVARDGTFEIHVGARGYFYGKAGRDGKDNAARFRILDGSGSGNESYVVDYPATVAFGYQGAAYAVKGTVLVDTSTATHDGQTPVDYAITLARDLAPVTSG